MARRFDFTKIIHERWGIEDHLIVVAWSLFLRVLAISELGQGTRVQLEAAKAAFVKYMEDRHLVMLDEEELEKPNKLCIAHEDVEDQLLYIMDEEEVRSLLTEAVGAPQ
jgi:hypothetical protein